MSQQSDTEPARPKKTKSDWRIKLAFLLVAAAIIIYFWHSSRTLPLDDWDDDLAAAMQRASVENRPVVVFFMSKPPGYNARHVMSIIKRPENRNALDDGNFVRVKCQVSTRLDSELARRYKLKQLPTLVLLDPGGKEANRRQGTVGELDFRNGFLDRTRIETP